MHADANTNIDLNARTWDDLNTHACTATDAKANIDASCIADSGCISPVASVAPGHDSSAQDFAPLAPRDRKLDGNHHDAKDRLQSDHPADCSNADFRGDESAIVSLANAEFANVEFAAAARASLANVESTDSAIADSDASSCVSAMDQSEEKTTAWHRRLDERTPVRQIERMSNSLGDVIDFALQRRADARRLTRREYVLICR